MCFNILKTIRIISEYIQDTVVTLKVKVRSGVLLMLVSCHTDSRLRSVIFVVVSGGQRFVLARARVYTRKIGILVS